MRLRSLTMAAATALVGLAPMAASATEPKEPREYTVYFDYGQAGLSQGLVQLRSAVDYGGPNARYEVVGHSVEDEGADVAGQRSNSVWTALHVMGVDADRISTASDPYPARRVHNAERRATIIVHP